MTDPVGKLRSQMRTVVLLLFLSFFLAGAAVQKLLPLLGLLAIFILIRLSFVAIRYWLERNGL